MSRVPLLWVSSLPHSCKMVQISQSCIWKLFSIDLYNITISRMFCFVFASSLLGTCTYTVCTYNCFCTLCANHLLSFFWHWSILQYSFVLFWAIAAFFVNFFELLQIIATVNYAAFVLCKSSVLSWRINKTSAICIKKYYATANHFPGMLFSSILLSSTLPQWALQCSEWSKNG